MILYVLELALKMTTEVERAVFIIIMIKYILWMT